MNYKSSKYWWKLLREFFIHWLFSIVVLLVAGLCVYAVMYVYDPEYFVDQVWAAARFFALLPYFLIFPVPFLSAVFFSYFIVQSTMDRVQKLVYSALIYIVCGSVLPVVMVLSGVLNDYEHIVLAGRQVMFGWGMYGVYAILIVSNYGFMLFRNNSKFKIKNYEN